MCSCFSYSFSQQLLTVNLNEKFNSSKFNLSLEPNNYDCTLKNSRITAFDVSLVTKGHLESPSVFFGKRLDKRV